MKNNVDFEKLTEKALEYMKKEPGVLKDMFSTKLPIVENDQKEERINIPRINIINSEHTDNSILIQMVEHLQGYLRTEQYESAELMTNVLLKRLRKNEN